MRVPELEQHLFGAASQRMMRQEVVSSSRGALFRLDPTALATTGTNERDIVGAVALKGELLELPGHYDRLVIAEQLHRISICLVLSLARTPKP